MSALFVITAIPAFVVSQVLPPLHGTTGAELPMWGYDGTQSLVVENNVPSAADGADVPVPDYRAHVLAITVSQSAPLSIR